MYKPIFTITNKILRNIGSVEAAKEVIKNAPLLPYYEKEFQKDAMVRAVHYGTHIEGNELDLSQAERVVMGQQIVARERDIQEVINYREVMEYIGNFNSSSPSINEDLIFDLHKMTVKNILPPETQGVYRKTTVVIKSSVSGEVTFRPPSAVVVPIDIGDFIAYLNMPESHDIHPVLRSGIVHYEIVRIHPFVDGNGRLARALSTLTLYLDGYDIRKFFSLEEFFDSDAPRYYDALQSVEKSDGDLTTWLEYFTEGLSVELNKIKDKVEHVSVDAKIKERLGGKQFLMNDRQMKIIEYIQKTGYLQNKGFKILFPMISEDSVLLDLQALTKAGVIKKTGMTKGARYIMA